MRSKEQSRTVPKQPWAIDNFFRRPSAALRSVPHLLCPPCEVNPKIHVRFSSPQNPPKIFSPPNGGEFVPQKPFQCSLSLVFWSPGAAGENFAFLLLVCVISFRFWWSLRYYFDFKVGNRGREEVGRRGGFLSSPPPQSPHLLGFPTPNFKVVEGGCKTCFPELWVIVLSYFKESF